METHYLSFRGKVNIPEGLLDGHDYHIALKGEIRGFTSSPDDRGGRDIVWRFAPMTVEILKPTGETIKASKYRDSQIMRFALKDKWQVSKENIDFEDYYHREMIKMIREINGEENS